MTGQAIDKVLKLEQEVKNLQEENTRWEKLYRTNILWMDHHDPNHDPSQLKTEWEQVLQDRIAELEAALKVAVEEKQKVERLLEAVMILYQARLDELLKVMDSKSTINRNKEVGDDYCMS